MKLSGMIQKMETEFENPVNYFLPFGDEKVNMNDLLGKTITLTWLNEIKCIGCGKSTKKSFGQGYCYPCFISSPETEECILHPELCLAHEGIARDMKFAEEHCLQDHFVYLALSSDLKVGVTRQSQVPTRWIDQGAWKAIKLAQTPNRYLAGVIEVELKNHLKDKTNWREMLKNILNTNIDLIAEKQRIGSLIKEENRQYLIHDDTIWEIKYPVVKYPEKPISIDFEKLTEVHGMLIGIKGQYLIFENGVVINIRKHNGYVVELDY
jgi:hypothetical protein